MGDIWWEVGGWKQGHLTLHPPIEGMGRSKLVEGMFLSRPVIFYKPLDGKDRTSSVPENTKCLTEEWALSKYLWMMLNEVQSVALKGED